MSAERASISTSGQVSLPAALRHRWQAGSVLVIDRGGYAIVRPVPADPVGELRGSYAGPGPSAAESRKAMRAGELPGAPPPMA